MSKKYYTLDQIITKLKQFAEKHDYDDDFDAFYELTEKIMADNQTYFQWDTDDYFDIDDAFDTLLSCLKLEQGKGRQIKDYACDFLFDDGRLFVFVEYK